MSEWRVRTLPDGRAVEYVHTSVLGVEDGEVIAEVSYTIDGIVESAVVRFRPTAGVGGETT